MGTVLESTAATPRIEPAAPSHPLGVALVVALLVVVTVAGLMVGPYLIVLGTWLADRVGDATPLVLATETILGVGCIAIGIAAALTARGLWQSRAWAWPAALAIGLVLLVLVGAWLWLPRLPRREATVAAAVVASVGLLSLPIAAALDGDQPWWDYRAWDWFGKGEVRTLARAEWVGGQPLLRGEVLLCGFYINELLLRLLPREDPHEALFARYQDTLQRLAGQGDSAAALRSFERALLKELGYAMTLERDAASGSAIDAAKSYSYDPERGPIEANGTAPEPRVSGRTLLAMARDDYSDPATQLQAKALMRTLLNHRLDHQPLKSREIFKDLLSL